MFWTYNYWCMTYSLMFDIYSSTSYKHLILSSFCLKRESLCCQKGWQYSLNFPHPFELSLDLSATSIKSWSWQNLTTTSNKLCKYTHGLQFMLKLILQCIQKSSSDLIILFLFCIILILVHVLTANWYCFLYLLCNPSS